jgi:hypothetical protein
LVITISISFIVIPSAHASNISTVHSLSHCAVEFVQLHGNSSPEVTCLKQEGASGKISPHTYGTDCSSNTLQLSGLDGLGRLTLCFLGTGFINLTDYTWRVWPDTWNDRATRYSTGCNYGVFYADIDGGGSSQSFTAGQSDLFSGHPLNQLTLSSFSITRSC